MVVGFCLVLMFLFVPETFWDRTPRPHSKSRRTALASLSRIFHHNAQDEKVTLHAGVDGPSDMRRLAIGNSASAAGSGGATIAERRQQRNAQHVGFADQAQKESEDASEKDDADFVADSELHRDEDQRRSRKDDNAEGANQEVPRSLSPASHRLAAWIEPRGEGPPTPGLHNFNSPFYVVKEEPGTDYLKNEHEGSGVIAEMPGSTATNGEAAAASVKTPVVPVPGPGPQRYTTHLRTQPAKTYRQTLKPWNGKLRHENWFKVAFRPFILFAYPSILWSTVVYSLSIGWLIVLSESVSTIFENKATYNFTPLQAGLCYVSPFIGGVLGTAVAGKVSDVIVQYMSRRNGGVYEPEFRLVMAIPISITTCIGLMGYGWSAQERDNWIVPTVFFGVISFGCALGSTTSITFAVDSYRQYAGEALVTLNFSKSKSRNSG